MSIKILTDSCCDLPITYLDAHSETLSFIGMPITVGQRHFRDDLGRKESLEFFYNELASGINASTAQITPNDFYEIFKAETQKGNSVIYIGLSSGLSGTYNNAMMAKQMLADEGDKGQIYVIDDVAASIGLGLMIMKTIEFIEAGKLAEEIVLWLEENKYCFHHWFAIDDLHYLKRGGRIPPALAVVGSVLNVKPILTVDEGGKLVKHTNVRGRKKAIKYLSDKVEENKLTDTKIVIGHGNCYEDAIALKKKVMELSPTADVVVTNLSATIGCHVGPNMLGIGFVAESRI